MAKSQKSKRGGKKRHYRKLRQQRDRKKMRESRKYVPAKVTIRSIFRDHKVEVAVLLIIIGISVVYYFGQKDVPRDLGGSLSSLVEEKSPDWEKSYPYGYKIFIFKDKEMVQTPYDTLPEDFEIDWKKLSVTRVLSQQTGGVVEKIRIELSDIYYELSGVSGTSFQISFIRKKGAKTVLTGFGDKTFMAEIIEDTGEQVWCLFGLR